MILFALVLCLERTTVETADRAGVPEPLYCPPVVCERMSIRSSVQPLVYIIGVMGAVALAYSAGFTRAYVLTSDIPITPEKEIISLGGLPSWVGIVGFAGMGFVLIFLVVVAIEPDFNTGL